MAAMIMNDSEKEWMTPLLNFRNYIGNIDFDRDRRDFRRMSGKAHLFKGRLVHGPYKKEVREEWLRMLLEIQRDIMVNGPESYGALELITADELINIRQIWLDEKHEFDDSLPRIYEDVMKTPFETEASNSGSSFGASEWELLANVCKDMYPDEELLFEITSSIVDVESKSTDMRKRYGIAKAVEARIMRGFYRNEEDALQYATHSHTRKKEMGASFDLRAEADTARLSSSGALEDCDEAR